jgi:hypothetical protein
MFNSIGYKIARIWDNMVYFITNLLNSHDDTSSYAPQPSHSQVSAPTTTGLERLYNNQEHPAPKHWTVIETELQSHLLEYYDGQWGNMLYYLHNIKPVCRMGAELQEEFIDNQFRIKFKINQISEFCENIFHEKS